ncbi:MAG TPA: SAM-dependent methyltransferase [Desulfotignum sp.]|nr:SAM-dependent methyltransferase [Desulfotignum sp.]
MKKGKFFVVGTGPGGPDQTTLEALRCIETADLILCPEETKTRFASYIGGKPVYCNPWEGLFDYKGKPWRELVHSDPSLIETFKKERIRIREEIVGYVKEQMATGKNVALIENGDPCLFGPSHWFIEGFEADEVEILPGVGTFSVAMAALKKSSIPAYDTRFVMQTSPFFLTENDQDDDIFRDLSKYPATMVFYMALWNLENLIKRLTEQYPENLPVAVIYHLGHDEKQHIVQGTLKTIVEKVRDIKEDFAGLIIVGKCLEGAGYRNKTENLVRV